MKREIKEKKSTIMKYLKKGLKVDMQNRVRDITMARSNKTDLVHFTETTMWCFLRPIDISVIEPQNEFTGDRAPSVPYYSDVQVPVKHDFSNTFERDKFDGRFLGKFELHHIVNFL